MRQIKFLGATAEEAGFSEEGKVVYGWLMLADFNVSMFSRDVERAIGSQLIYERREEGKSFSYTRVSPALPEFVGNMVKMWYPSLDMLNAAIERLKAAFPG